jgi:hypothetical protein
MSDNTVQMEAQSPQRSPEPLHLRPLPERPFAMPISPQSALVALSLADGDEEALKSLSQSLITTIQKHTREVRQTNDAKDAHIRELEQTLGGFLPVFEAPDGYLENDDSRAPNLNIPIQDGYYQPAHWVKQLDNGQVAALPKEYTIADIPYICDIYAHLHGADDSDEDPILPMQPWLLELLTGPTNAFNALYKEAQKRSNWETLAEIQRFRELEHTIIDTQSRINFLQAQVRGAKQAQNASQGRLEASRLDRTVANLRTLPNMGQRNFGEFRQSSQKRKFNRQ